MNEEVSNLYKKIEELRAVLNEMSTNLLNINQPSKLEILYISQKLDSLITEYLVLTNKNKSD